MVLEATIFCSINVKTTVDRGNTMAAIRGKKFPMVPYACLYIDASWKDLLSAISFSMEPSHRRSLMEYKLDRLWNQDHAAPSPILPCLSVRTAFDLFLSVKKYPRGSEMIFCAINIPDMARIVRHHGIKLVSLDVDMEAMTPKVEHLESLITPKTVAILLAHLYGRWIDLEDIISIAKRHHLDILEDCAEAFCGVQNHGHPAADVSFFSFGLIKSCTAFGGSIAVVRNPTLLSQMRTLYHSYPIRARSVYLKKLFKYSMVMAALNSPFILKHATLFVNALGINHRDLVVNYIRGFPKDFFDNIRMRPSITLLCMLYRRLKNFDTDSFNLGNIKGDFVSERLPPGIQGVGLKAKKCNHWLFPIVVDDPERVLKELNSRGVDAYRGATQLTLIESDVAIPSNLSHPSVRVHGGFDASSETAESTSRTDEACNNPSRRRRAIVLSPHHVDDLQDGSVQSFHGKRANYIDAHSKQATRNSNKSSRDLISESHSSNNHSIPSTVSSSSPGPYRFSRMPSKLQESCHFAMASDSISAAINVGRDPSASRRGDAEDLSSVTLQHHHGSHAQSVSERASEEDTCVQTRGTYDIENPPCDQPLTKREPKRQSASMPTLNHPPWIKGSSNHSSDTPVAHLTDTQRLPEPPSSNTDLVFGGDSQDIPEQSGKSPIRTLGESAGAMSGKYPHEARYLIDHVVYLPVHKKVPFHYLEQICAGLEDVANMLAKEKPVKLQSKL